MTKLLSAGGECDAWCTRCRRDTLHNIVAMTSVGTIPARVECRSCGGVHNFRVPKASEKPKKSAVAAKAKASAGAGAAGKAYTAEWERLSVELSAVEEKSYDVRENYEPKDVIRHKKFGLGFVSEITGTSKIRVLFHDEERILLANYGKK